MDLCFRLEAIISDCLPVADAVVDQLNQLVLLVLLVFGIMSDCLIHQPVADAVVDQLDQKPVRRLDSHMLAFLPVAPDKNSFFRLSAYLDLPVLPERVSLGHSFHVT